jgi:SAM-dependent methyltransferase
MAPVTRRAPRAPATFDIDAVRRYYDRHTAAFVSHGQRGSDGAIHRAVWGPGTRTRVRAFRYVEDRIAELLRGLVPSRGTLNVVDLGCGVGTSLCYLAASLPIRGIGITLSPIQARLAAQRVADAGFGDRVRCVEGDYCDLPQDVGPADLAYGIESFVHVQDPARFFFECGRLVRPGGLLLICDDFRRPTDDSAAAATIERFRRGWHVNTLLDRDEFRSLANAHGFEHEETTDLSGYLELGRLRDRFAAVLLALAQWVPIDGTRIDYLEGGRALQTSLARGWIGYDFVILRRAAE